MKKCFLCLIPMLILSLLVCSCADNSKLTQNNTVQPTRSAATTIQPSNPPQSIAPVKTQSPVPTQHPVINQPVLSSINHYVIKADVKAYLSQEEIVLFQKVMDAIFAQKKEVILSEDYDSNLRILGALSGSPYYFFVKQDRFSKDHTKVLFTYGYSASEQAEMAEFMDKEYLTLINENITSDMNELEKVLAIYRYFASRISYDYEWLYGLDMADDKFLYPDIEIYQALKTDKGVCHTYTYLCEFALQQLGIECLRFTGEMTDKKDAGHMWLVVRIDGEYYHCDPTWDSNGAEVGLKYFGMTDEERTTSGVTFSNLCIDGAYGQIVCNSKRFADFRDVSNFEINNDHSITLYKDDGSAPVRWSTVK